MPFWLSEILWRIWDKVDIGAFLFFYLLSIWGCLHNGFWAACVGTFGITLVYLNNRSGN